MHLIKALELDCGRYWPVLHMYNVFDIKMDNSIFEGSLSCMSFVLQVSKDKNWLDTCLKEASTSIQKCLALLGGNTVQQICARTNMQIQIMDGHGHDVIEYVDKKAETNLVDRQAKT